MSKLQKRWKENVDEMTKSDNHSYFAIQLIKLKMTRECSCKQKMKAITEVVLIDIDHINKSMIRQSRIDSFVKQNDSSSKILSLE